VKQWWKLPLSILICELTGLIVTPLTIASIPTWYQTLNKPFFNPPNWLFGPVWTLLYFMMGISMYLIWKLDLKKKQVGIALQLFWLQLGFNAFWSILFFGLRQPLIAFFDIIALWITIAFTIRRFTSLSKPAAYLLVPYMGWVSFAALLNLAIVILN
jgi:tryptophan-rich sensory protein